MDRLDIILLGATGFTGKYAAKNLALLSKETSYSDIRWGVAGRSKEKLQNLVSELQDVDVNTASIPVLQCDIINQESTLLEVTGRTKIVMNATGPNTVLSAPIVEACIKTGTHYVDITAELYHFINIYRDFHKAAEKAGVLIIPSCGFASIPVTVGLMHLERHFKGTLHSVECYTVLDLPTRCYFPFPGHNNSLIHYGTWLSLIYELRNYRKYRDLKQLTFPKSEDYPDELRKSFFHIHKRRVWYPYPGPEHDIIEQTQRNKREEGKTPYYFKIYTTMPHFILLLIIVPVFFLYYFLCRFACFRKFLSTFPRFFSYGLASHKGPTEQMRNNTKYSFTLNGKGFSSNVDLKSTPDKSLTVKISGKDPGYQTTVMAFIFAAITVLRERSSMPTGGVLTSVTAFSNTDIVNRFSSANDVKLELLEKESPGEGHQ